MVRSISILGTRGIPATHGGFETFAEHLALYLTKRGWSVTVYCQDGGPSRLIREDEWQGVRRITLPVSRNAAAGTIEFDWRSIGHAIAQRAPLILTLGYNTAVFCVRFRIAGIPNLINMDGIEWRREKWRRHEKAWLWLNEWAGCWLGDWLIADHPEIAKHLLTRRANVGIATIPYGAERVVDLDPSPLRSYGLDPGDYVLVVARPEPENLILEIVRAYSRRRRSKRLVILGRYHADANCYHEKVIRAASDEVRFLGAIYDRTVVNALRYHTHLYVHGHTVGGTNPSLVEALGAGSPVLAHDNPFNRWVAGSGAHYFNDEDECARQFDELLSADVQLEAMRRASRQRHEESFTWEGVLAAYEQLLDRWVRRQE